MAGGISPNQLTPSEASTWGYLDRILDYMGGRPLIVSDIRISETMSGGDFTGRETLGLWDPQNNWIILKRSLLGSLELFAGTLLHEALHAKYAVGDVSRDFEQHLTDLCGKLAAQSLSQESRHERRGFLRSWITS